jgi:hypothetical protein
MSQDSHNRTWTVEELSLYHKGKLSVADRHALEADALEDPFLNDALEAAAEYDLPKLTEELDTRWESSDGNNAGKGSGFSWKHMLYTAMSIGVIWMLYSVWTSQYEISDLRHTIAQEQQENEVLVYQYQDSLKLLEITLAQEIPAEDQLDAEQTIADQRLQQKPDVNTNPSVTSTREVKKMDSIRSLSVEIGDGDLSAKLRLEEFPVIYVHELKVADYRTAHTAPEFILPGILSGTPAAMETKRDAKDEAGKQLTYQEFLSRALNAFSKKDYKNSLVMLERIAEKYPRDENAKFYSALCMYNLGKWDKAAAMFREAELHENRVFHEEAEFYRALSKLNAGDEQEAKRILRSIVDKQSFYAQRAQQYLGQ